MANTTSVTFWRQLDGRVVAQKRDKFFPFPKSSDMGEDHEVRIKVAENFDSAPLLENAMDIAGATVIETVEVAA